VKRPATTILLLSLFAAAGQAQPTSVILISVDTLRADHLSAYGYTRVRTPNMDSFAEHGTLFTQADCQVPLTLPSHTSLFTSTYPFENQVEENAEVVPQGAVTLASVLRSHGYRTAAFIGSVFLERQVGIDQGFDFYDSPFNFEALSPLSGSMFFGAASHNPLVGKDRRDGALVLRAARQWLAANRGQAVFAFVHLFDMHKPYATSYDAQLAYVDRLLGGFQQALMQLGWWDRSLVVLVSDHGESLGEHGESSHGYFIYESTLRVPLIFHWPAGAANHAAQAAEPAGLIDVAPTILEFLRLLAPPSFEGTSLLATHGAVYAESLNPHDAFGWAPLRSLRAGAYKYIEAPRPELYNLAADPREQHNLFVKGSPKALELEGQLAKLLARYAPKRPASPSDQSPQTRALLNSLGYLSAGPRAALGGSGPDPKDRLPEFHLYEDSQLALYYRRLNQALAILIRLLARDPHNTLARRDLAGTYVELKEYGKARANFQQVLAVAPDDYMSQFELGLSDEHLGLLKEAEEHLQAACRIAPRAQQGRRELEAVEQKMK
jgi:arylsulfatase A-like enzyme